MVMWLHEAVRNDDVVAVLALIAQEADVTAEDPYAHTPLHFAKNADIIRVLLKHGAHVDATNIHGYTPLHLVVRASCPQLHITHIDLVRLLLHHGANVNAKTNWG